MIKRLRVSLRELMLLTVIASLVAAMVRMTLVEAKPVYLHVFGTRVDQAHDGDRPNESPTNLEGLPWTRIATVHVFPGRPFGFFTPNDRSPAIAIDGKLTSTWEGTYRGRLHFLLDDNNLTFDFTEDFNLAPDEINYIDEHYDCFVLSRWNDPYKALDQAKKAETSRTQRSAASTAE